MFVDIHAADPSRLSCPEVALPAADPHKAQVVEFDVAVMALADVPKQHRLAKTVVGRLGEGARAGNRAAAVVEPLAGDVPIRNVAHPALRSNAVSTIIALLRTASGNRRPEDPKLWKPAGRPGDRVHLGHKVGLRGMT